MQTYPASVEEKLGFDVIRSELARLMQSPLGTERLGKIRPAGHLGWLEGELGRVSELQDAFRYDDAVPLSPMLDVRDTLRQAAPEGSFVDAEALRDVRRVARTSRRLARYVADRAGDYPHLADSVRRITPVRDLEDHIGRVVNDDGRVRDDASPELRRLRRAIIDKQSQLRATLERALRDAISQGYATESQPTIRGGRMVIPVRAEAKRKVEGFVHDTSATGQTVYIEPAAVLNLNNEVHELKADERREVERLLREVTGHVRAKRPELDDILRTLAQFDLLQAKARLANRLDAVVPTLTDRTTEATDGPVIKVYAGRNPVLHLHFDGDGGANPVTEERAAREVVPLDLELGADFRTLVITGPNAGGKTVAMKTVGLFALMLAYGLPIPVAPHSTFALFDRLIVDIGDEQSIEEDLSTFSSHVANLRHMMDKAGAGTLVLIDEAGTGTDPEEGGALAQAVLERLSAMGALTIATTHHGTLKVYAHETEGVENGSMAFDQKTLRPTYRYQAGVPGSSYAFEIADRMGLEEGVLERARALAGEQKTKMERLITTFEQRNQELEDRLYEAKRTVKDAEQQRERFEGKRRKLEKERAEIRQQALEEAERIVQGANARVERTIREIKEAAAAKEATKAAREELEQFKGDVQDRRSDVQARLEEEAEAARAEEAAAQREAARERAAGASGDGASGDGAALDKQPGAPIAAGDRVVLDDGTTKLEVQEVSGDEAVVLMGAMHMRVDVGRLTKVGGSARGPAPAPAHYATGDIAALKASRAVDLRGQRVEEGLHTLRRFLDDAIAANLDTVEILHGKGTGALREAVHETLSSRGDVQAYRLAPIEEGGSGVTYAELA